MCEESENYAVPLKQFVQVTLEEFVNHMIGKIPSRSETQITEAAKEIGVLAEKERLENAIEARKMAIGLEATGANSKWEFEDVGGATRVIREEGITKRGIFNILTGQ